MNTILLGNLIKIRWIAIFGQLCALFVVTYILNIKIPLYESLTVIVLSVLPVLSVLSVLSVLPLLSV